MSWIDAQGKEHALIRADHDAVVHDPELGFDRQIIAGQYVPPELQEAYESGATSKSPSKGSEEDSVDAQRRSEHQAARAAAKKSGASGSQARKSSASSSNDE